jgi:hypothetical protein
MADDKALLDDESAKKKMPTVALMITAIMFLMMGLMSILSPDTMVQSYGVPSLEATAEGLDDPELNVALRIVFWATGVNFFFCGMAIAQICRSSDLLTLGRVCCANFASSVCFVMMGVHALLGHGLDGAPELKAGNLPFSIQFTLIAVLNLVGFMKSGQPAPSFAVVEGKSPPGYPTSVPFPYWCIRFWALTFIMNTPFIFFPGAGLQMQGFPEKVWDGQLAGSMVIQEMFRTLSLVSLWMAFMLGTVLMGHNTTAIYNMVRAGAFYFVSLLCMIGGGMNIFKMMNFAMSGIVPWAVMSIIGIIIMGALGMSKFDQVRRYAVNTKIGSGPYDDIGWATFVEVQGQIKEAGIPNAY